MSSVQLVRTTTNGIKRHVNATHVSGGDLEISIHDLGPGASMHDDEYEAWYTVEARHVPEFCRVVGVDPADPLRGLAESYSGDRFDTLVDLMRKTTIVGFHSHW